MVWNFWNDSTYSSLRFVVFNIFIKGTNFSKYVKQQRWEKAHAKAYRKNEMKSQEFSAYWNHGSIDSEA
jgi:UTP:GlnB (protein PII) uridylyltransferase